MTFIVATNVVASRPPERRPTGTSHARAKNETPIFKIEQTLSLCLLKSKVYAKGAQYAFLSTKNVKWGIIWRLGPVTTGHLLLVKSHACVLPEGGGGGVGGGDGGGGGGVGGLGRVGKSDRGSRHRLTRPGQTNVLHSDRWTQTETRLETAGQRCAATRQQLQTCGATTQFMDLKYMGRDLAPKYFPPKVVTWLSWVYLGQNYPPPCQPSQRESLGHVPAPSLPSVLWIWLFRQQFHCQEGSCWT